MLWRSWLAIAFIVLVSFGSGWAAVAPFTERGVTDFDTVIRLLEPHGQWREVKPDQWRFYPSDRSFRPFTQGRWVYTDFGWYWDSATPHGWATEHYGVWRLEESGVWGWQPDPYWHPHCVDFRIAGEHIGWRPSALTRTHEFVEREEQRFAKPQEWTFIPKKAFGEAITPGALLAAEKVAQLLEESEPCYHLYVSWREMERLGPDPFDHVPKSWVRNEEDLKPGEPAITTPVLWSLPTFDTPRPADAKPGDIYLYRPKFHQDADGIQRRVLVKHRSSERDKNVEQVNRLLQTGGGGKMVDTALPASPQPAVTAPLPAEPAPEPQSKDAKKSSDSSTSTGGGGSPAKSSGNSTSSSLSTKR